MSQSIKIIRNERGQAAVELAIILPIVLLIVMFIVYVGILTFSKSVVLIATHEGGREAVRYWNVGSMTIEEKEQKMMDATLRTLAALPRGTESEIRIYDDQVGKLTVKVTYFYKLNLPFLKQITGYDAVPLSSELTFRYTKEVEEW